jgi:hypothetical protein
MAQPTLQEVFGPNAAQTATSITLTKADYANNVTVDGVTYGGLTANSGNNGEQLFTAIVISALQNLTITNRLADFDHSIEIVNQGQDIVAQNATTYRRFVLSVRFYNQEDLAPLDPDDM